MTERKLVVKILTKPTAFYIINSKITRKLNSYKARAVGAGSDILSLNLYTYSNSSDNLSLKVTDLHQIFPLR